MTPLPSFLPALALALTVGACSDDAVHLAFPEGRIAFVSDRDGDREIYLIEPDGKHLIQVTTNTEDDHSPSFSPDGRHLAYVSTGQTGRSTVILRDLDGGGVQELAVRGSPSLLSWSPDGTGICYTDTKDSRLRIVRLLVGSGAEVVALEDAMCLSWAPDGSRAIFSSGQIPVLCVVDDLSDEPRPFLQLDDPWDMLLHPSFAARWSPRGDLVLFTRVYPGGSVVDPGREGTLPQVFKDLSGITEAAPVRTLNRELCTADGSGRKIRRLTDHAGNDMGCAWSPKGDRVLFVSDRDGNLELYIMALESGEVFRLTNDPAADSEADWSPAR